MIENIVLVLLTFLRSYTSIVEVLFLNKLKKFSKSGKDDLHLLKKDANIQTDKGII